MRHTLQRSASWLGAVLLGLAAASAPAFAEEPRSDTVNQIKLTEAQVKNFITAQPDLATVAPKLQEAGESIDAKLQGELDELAKKHGFANFTELDDVAANISIVMAGLDTKSGEFTDPIDALKKELDDVQKDTSIPEADKKQLVDELTEAIKTAQPLQHKENIELVKAHREEIEKALR